MHLYPAFVFGTPFLLLCAWFFSGPQDSDRAALFGTFASLLLIAFYFVERQELDEF